MYGRQCSLNCHVSQRKKTQKSARKVQEGHQRAQGAACAASKHALALRSCYDSGRIERQRVPSFALLPRVMTTETPTSLPSPRKKSRSACTRVRERAPTRSPMCMCWCVFARVYHLQVRRGTWHVAGLRHQAWTRGDSDSSPALSATLCCPPSRPARAPPAPPAECVWSVFECIILSFRAATSTGARRQVMAGIGREKGQPLNTLPLKCNQGRRCRSKRGTEYATCDSVARRVPRP